MAVEEGLVELAQGGNVVTAGRKSGAWDMDAVWRSLQDHDLGLGVGIAHQIASTLGAAPFHASVGSVCLMG
jgi:hypothetical protein